LKFREYLASEEPHYGTSTCPERVEILAREWEFKKPWYEFHAAKFLWWIDGGLDCLCQWAANQAHRPIRPSGNERAPWDCDFVLSGQLGRLVEQYYWKFRFEKDAITGVGARTGASRGGQLKAKKMKNQQSRWQTSASDIWKRHPEWGKMAVAEHIKKQLGEARTVKHITRYISQPKS
jgi:hypothetical protein